MTLRIYKGLEVDGELVAISENNGRFEIEGIYKDDELVSMSELDADEQADIASYIQFKEERADWASLYEDKDEYFLDDN